MIRARKEYSWILLFLDFAVLTALAMSITLTGCERKRKVLDVDTPRTDVGITQDKDTGRIEVDVKNK